MQAQSGNHGSSDSGRQTSNKSTVTADESFFLLPIPVCTVTVKDMTQMKNQQNRYNSVYTRTS